MVIFQTQNIAMPHLDLARVKKWIGQVAEAHGRTVGNISYTFVDDETMLKANNRFLCHDYYTDIITFDFSGRTRIGGDIIISLDTVLSNAEQFNQPYDRELMRVIIHGVLHLCGINDKGPGEREIMEQNEDEALAMYDQIFVD